MYFSTSPGAAARSWRPAVLPFLCLLGPAAGLRAEPLPFDPRHDPRTAGSLPPEAQAATSAKPLRPSLELPGGNVWLRGEVPSGDLDPKGAIRAANASFGVRLPLTITNGIGLETKPMLTGSALAASHPGIASISPGIGFAVAETLSVALPMGLRIAAEGTIGDRLGIFGASAAASTTGSPLALRTGATLSTDLDVPQLDTRITVGLGISTTGGLAFGSPGASHPYEPADCKLSLDIGRVGGAPLRVSAPCQRQGTAGMPITFGFKAEF